MLLRQLTFRRVLVGGLLGVTVLAAAGCSSSSSGASATIPADAGLVIYAGPGIRFDTTDYTAKAGDVKVAYSNRDAQRHTLDIVNSDRTIVGKELAVGKSGDIDVSDYTLPAGTYTLECRVPGHEAMKATLVVK